MSCPRCDGAMAGPKYFDNGFRYFHVYTCSTCGHEEREQRPHKEWEENQAAMKQRDARKYRPRSAQSWQRMCLGKVKFATADAAQKVADKFGQRIYFCPFCSGHHCTKRPLDTPELV